MSGRWEHFHVEAAKRIYQLTDKKTLTLHRSMERALARQRKLDFLFRQVMCSYLGHAYPDTALPPAQCHYVYDQSAGRTRLPDESAKPRMGRDRQREAGSDKCAWVGGCRLGAACSTSGIHDFVCLLCLIVRQKFRTCAIRALRHAFGDNHLQMPKSVRNFTGIAANTVHMEQPNIIRADYSLQWLDSVQVRLANPSLSQVGETQKRKNPIQAPDGTVIEYEPDYYRHYARVCATLRHIRAHLHSHGAH